MRFGGYFYLPPSESPTCPDCRVSTRVVVDMEGDVICTSCGLVFKSEKYFADSYSDHLRTSSEGCASPRINRYNSTPIGEKKAWKRRMLDLCANNENWYPANAALRAQSYVDWTLDVHTFSSRDQSVVSAACLYQV